ncbi:uncharacterized protein [Heliangelus exortis]|uniref:uncharacterized protein isoform X2 n=1 Tax=Heliangelus exortis TaxID=472823 RepID=UPI003A8D03E8
MCSVAGRMLLWSGGIPVPRTTIFLWSGNRKSPHGRKGTNLEILHLKTPVEEMESFKSRRIRIWGPNVWLILSGLLEMSHLNERNSKAAEIWAIDYGAATVYRTWHKALVLPEISNCHLQVSNISTCRKVFTVRRVCGWLEPSWESHVDGNVSGDFQLLSWWRVWNHTPPCVPGPEPAWFNGLPCTHWEFGCTLRGSKCAQSRNSCRVRSHSPGQQN